MSLNWYGAEIEAKIEANIKRKILECGQDLQNKSVNQAPKLTGDLRGNCAVDDSELNNLEIRVGYNLVYALRQHEGLEFKHTDGKAKFLEDPFNERKTAYIKYIGEGLI